MSSPQQVIKWLQIVLKNDNIKEENINITGTTEKGEGYVGDITFLTINNNDEELHIVLKSGKQQDIVRQFVPVHEAFSNEIWFYTKIFPEFTKIQDDKCVSTIFDNFPKCYGTLLKNKEENEEVLVLENLKRQGYSLLPREKPMHQNHILSVLKTYGRFHALSFALKDQDYNKFKELAEPLVSIWEFIVNEDNYKHMFDFYVKDCQRVLAEKSVEQEKIDKLEKLKECKITDKIFSSNEPNVVITHGDCWNNNFMFEFEDGDISKCKNLKILDWQVGRLGSPVMDLSYFIFTCGTSNELNNLDFLLKAYHDSLSVHLKELGSNVEKIFPYSELKKEWQKYGSYGAYFALSLLRVATFNKDDIPDNDQMTNANMEEIMENFRKECHNTDFTQRVFDIFSHDEFQSLL